MIKDFLRSRPIPTSTFPVEAFSIPDDCVYLSGKGTESRDAHVEELMIRCAQAGYIEVAESDPLVLTVTTDNVTRTILARSDTQLAAFWLPLVGKTVFLDVTGMPHRVWVPLLRSALAASVSLKVVYVEPMSYRFNSIRTEGELFDLSVRFEGVGSLPGFVALAEPDESDIMLVTLLGFEGQRFSMVLNEVQPVRENIVPVVGVPGFRPEFVFHAYHGNRQPLEETGSWPDIQFATANCPFSIYYLLEDLAAKYPNAFFKVALIGTKPHGVGAVLFAIADPSRVELLYDFPVKRAGRTEGSARVLVYDVSNFLH